MHAAQRWRISRAGKGNKNASKIEQLSQSFPQIQQVITMAIFAKEIMVFQCDNLGGIKVAIGFYWEKKMMLNLKNCQ